MARTTEGGYMAGTMEHPGPRLTTTGRTMPVPLTCDDLGVHYDLLVSHPLREEPASGIFERWLAEAATSYGLSCALIHAGVVEEAIRRVQSGELTIGLHLDRGSRGEAEDAFTRLAVAIQDAGGHPVNQPGRVRAFTNRASAHHELTRHEVGVLPAVFIRPWRNNLDLSSQDRWQLRLDEPGMSAWLRSSQGHLIHVEKPDPARLTEALRSARREHPQETWLVQPAIDPPWLPCGDGRSRPASWRAVSCLGEVALFWWSLGAEYREVTHDEVEWLRLRPIFGMVQALADLSGLEWFSTDLALCSFWRPGRFSLHDPDGQERALIALDPLEACGEVDVRSRCATAPPDAHVRRLAWRLAELAWNLRQQSVPPEGVVRLCAAG